MPVTMVLKNREIDFHFSIIECQCNYAMDAIGQIVSGGHSSIDVRTSVLEKYMKMIFKSMKETVWVSGCTSW